MQKGLWRRAMISFGLPRITYPHCRVCFFQRRPTDTVEGAASPKMRKRRAAQWAVAVLLEPPTQALLTEVVPARPHLHLNEHHFGNVRAVNKL